MPAPENDVASTKLHAKRSRFVRFKNIFRMFYGLGFIAAGISHFIIPGHYEPTIPPFLPAPELLNILAGVFATVLGALLIWPKTSRYAAWGIIVFLLAVFPSNIHMAMHPELYPQIPELSLWLRLPLQTLLISMAYWLSKR